jgi:hypothetical protein
MIVRRVLALLAVLGAVVAAAPARAQECATLLDLSGSMRGFMDTAQPRLPDLVAGLRRACPELVGFGSAPTSLAGVPPADRFIDGKTLIEKALQDRFEQRPMGAVVMVTDNVADSGGANDDQRRFYRRLRAGGFDFVAVVLLRLPFDGRTFAPDGTASPDRFQGERALTLYILSRGRDPAADEQVLKAVQDSLTAIGLKSAADTGPGRFTTVRLAPLDLSDNESPPVTLRRDRGVSVAGGTIVINPASVDDEVTFRVGLQPVLSRDWSVTASPLRAFVRFPADRFLGREISAQCETEPKVLRAGARSVDLKITCKIPPIRASATRAQLKELAKRRGTSRSGALEVEITVERETLALSGPLQKWSYNGDPARLASTDDPSVHAGVYALGDLLTQMIPERSLTTVIARAPLRQRAWNVEIGADTVSVLAIVLAIAALLAVVALLAIGREYEFTGGRGGGRMVRRLRPLQPVTVDPGGSRSAVATVVPVLAGFLVLARGGSVRPGFLPRDGGTFTLDPGGACSVRPVPQKPKTPRTSGGRASASGGRSSTRRRRQR